jgi:hypothetical protein
MASLMKLGRSAAASGAALARASGSGITGAVQEDGI